MRQSLIAVLAVLVAAAMAADPPVVVPTPPGKGEAPPVAPPAAIPFFFDAPGGDTYPLARSGGPGTIRGGPAGGVKLKYENCLLQADFVPFWMSPCDESGKPAVEWANLMPGKNGPGGDRVLVDTRATRLPFVGFQGIMRPQAVRAFRWPRDPEHPLRIYYLVDLDGAGDFAGQLRRGTEWMPIAGWADHIQAILLFRIDEGNLEFIGFHDLHFFGREPDSTKPRRPTVLMRLAKPLSDAKPLSTDDPLVTGWRSSRTLSIRFDANGDVQSLDGDSDVQAGGLRDLLSVPEKRKSRPVPTPGR